MHRILLTAAALVIAFPLAATEVPTEPAPPPADPEPVTCTGAYRVEGTVTSVEVTTVFELPRGTEGNGRKYVVLTALSDGGNTSRLLVPFEILRRGVRSAPNPGDSVRANTEVRVLHGFSTPQFVAESFTRASHD